MVKQYNPTSSDSDWASIFITGSLVWSLTSISTSLTAAAWYLRGSTLLTLLSHLVSDHIFKVMSTCFFQDGPSLCGGWKQVVKLMQGAKVTWGTNRHLSSIGHNQIESMSPRWHILILISRCLALKPLFFSRHFGPVVIWLSSTVLERNFLLLQSL